MPRFLINTYISYTFQCTGLTDPDKVSCVENWRVHHGGPLGCTSLQPGEAFLGNCCDTPGIPFIFYIIGSINGTYPLIFCFYIIPVFLKSFK